VKQAEGISDTQVFSIEIELHLCADNICKSMYRIGDDKTAVTHRDNTLVFDGFIRADVQTFIILLPVRIIIFKL